MLFYEVAIHGWFLLLDRAKTYSGLHAGRVLGLLCSSSAVVRILNAIQQLFPFKIFIVFVSSGY